MTYNDVTSDDRHLGMIGTSLAGRYTVVSELGRGGMGVVYRARDAVLSRDVAVKLVPPHLVGPATRERFQREARLVARLDHPAIIAIHDFGDHEGSLFLVMPVVEGRSLRALLAHGPRGLDEVLEIGIQTAEALDYSHARGVVHRDVKPENLMLTGGDGGLRVRVMDFGLALTAASDRLTQTGGLIGTPAYLSPEQLAGGEVDGRADIYALGVVLYECLAGEAPFSGIPYSLLYRIANEPPQPLSERGVTLPATLESMILACLAKRRDERPPRAGELAEAMRQLRAGKLAGTRPLEMAPTLAFATPRAAGPPLVGRGRELSELQRNLLAMATGECRFVAIGGEAGMGKSRLLEEVDRLARARELPVLHGRFAEHDRAIPFHGFCDVIRHYFRSRDVAETADFRDLAGDLLAFFPVLSEIPALRAAASEPSSGAVAGRGGDDRTYLFELLAKTLARCTGGKPLLVLLEHLHEADVSVEALRYLLLRLAGTPLLVVATYRTSEIDRRHPLRTLLNDMAGEPRSAHLLLAPLGPTECEHLAHAVLGGSALEPRLAARLYEASEGNPLFLLELLRSLVESGGMARDASGGWHLSGASALTPAALPSTVHQAVERRLARLPEDQRELLTLASVLGRGFELRDLEALLEERSGVEARSKLEAHLDRLVADGLLEEDRSSRADRLVFSSGVLRDVLYAAIPRRRRRSLHQRVAEHLERRWSGRLERVVPQLFFHCEQGDLAEKCVEYGLAAARFQLETFSPDDAARTLRTVLEFLRDEGFEGGVAGVETEARRLLAAAHRQAGDVAAALAELETALARCDQGDTAHRLELTALAAATAWEGRRIADTQRWVDEGLAAARAAGDHDELQRLLTLGATVANLAGRQAQATEYLSELESLAPAVASAADLPLGGIARVGMPMVLRAADPVMATTVEEAEVLATVFETLVTTDARGILLPLLAERWEALEGGQAFAFTLRAGVLLHDGRPLTAELVRESLVRAAELGREDLPAAIAALRGGREGAPAIVATGERELRFELAEPLSIFPAMLTDLRTAVAVPRVAEGGHGGHATLAGTGPFELASVAADRIVVEQWAKHWRNAPRVDVVEFRGGLSASALAQGVRDGTLDLAHGLEPEALEDVARDRHLGLTLLESPRRSLYFLLFAAGGALGTSRGARRALGGVLRLQDLVHASLGRLAQPAVGVLPPGVLGHDSGARRAPLAREEAEGLLLASGLPRPLHLRAAVHPALQDRYASLTAALLGAWAELGIDVEVVTRTLDDYRAAVHRATSPAAAGGDDAPLDLLLGRWIANYDDPDSFVGELFHSRAGYFRAWSAGPHLDEAMERARAEAEPAARERLYRRLEGLLADEARVVPLFHDLDCRVAGPRLRHVVLRGTLPYVGYAEMAVGEPPARPVARRERRGALRIPIAGRVQTLDPAQTIFTWQGDVIPTVFETLTRENEAAQIAPFLAARVEAADQGRRFRFRLREDVRFHDGRPLTARDVRWAFLRLLKNRANENRWLLSPIRGARHLLEDGQGDLPGCRVESDHELVLELEKAVSVFPALLAHPSAAIVPEGAETFDGNWMSGVVGTGPFRVTHFAPGARLELEANPGYWRPGLPRSQRLVFTFGWSPGEMAAGLRAGELSLVTQLPPAEVEELRRDPRLAAQHHEIPTLSTYYLVLNAHQGPLADEALRHELVSALDVAALVNKHIGRLGVPARGLVPPGLLGYRGQYRPSPTPAPRAVATTGERELTVLLQTAYSELYPELTSALLATLTARGFELNVIELKSSYRELIATTRVDLFLARWVADYPDADTFLYHLLHSEDGLLGHFLGDPEIDRLIEQGRREDSPEVRHDLYLAVERRLAERALLQPLFHEQSHCFVRAEVRGFARRFASVDVDHALLWVE